MRLKPPNRTTQRLRFSAMTSAHRAHMTSGRPNPGHVNGRSAGDGLGAAIGAGFTPLRFWQLAGSMFFQGLSQFHADPR